MRAEKRSRGKAGRPPLLSQELIVAAAQRIIDEGGDGSLSMRSLARELRITPMALYHHVRNRDHLLLLLLEKKARSHPWPTLPEEPRERLGATARLLYETLADCPFQGEILFSHELMAASTSWIVENFVESAVECGLAPDQAVAAYHTIWHYTAGELMVRLARERRDSRLDHPVSRVRAFAAADPVLHPRLSALADRWSGLTGQDTHSRALEAIVDGLLRTYGQSPHGVSAKNSPSRLVRD